MSTLFTAVSLVPRFQLHILCKHLLNEQNNEWISETRIRRTKVKRGAEIKCKSSTYPGGSKFSTTTC